MDWIGFMYWFIKFYLSPMIANASPVLVRGNKRIDSGKVFIDGKPLFGPNKTWEGFLLGFYLGSLTSLLVALLYRDELLILIGSGASLSALLGDLTGSFIKRRLGIKSGDPLPLLDQLDFAVFASLYYTLLDLREFYKPLYVLVSLVIITVLHILTNRVAYLLGVKDKKW
ncbi:MAG: CDP-2,3-bis-(O-geranylgeranyl)-sn-glycerol synthase [Thermoprotei archaeon]